MERKKWIGTEIPQRTNRHLDDGDTDLDDNSTGVQNK